VHEPVADARSERYVAKIAIENSNRNDLEPKIDHIFSCGASNGSCRDAEVRYNSINLMMVVNGI
jgi:hypothetical protein